MAEIKNDIELRSEKVRNIVGKIPPVLLRIGIAVISLFVIIIIAASYFIPWPETQIFAVLLYSTPQCEIIKAPEDGFVNLKEQLATIEESQTIALFKEKNDSIIPIKSLFKGKLIINCRDKSFVEKGDILFSIIPENIKDIYGIIVTQGVKINRIKKGQSVKIELSDFPAKNYGLIDGEVSKIYPIAGDGAGHKVEIHLKNGFKSTNDYAFKYTPLMDAKATVFISNESFLKRIIDSSASK